MSAPPAPGGVAPDRVFAVSAADGVGLRGAVWAGGARGLVLILPGRTETVEKAAIPAAVLRARGFAVAALDWRGQGHSDRLAEPALMGHVEDFSAYLSDLDALLAAPEMAALGPPVAIIAHSMGGTIALVAEAAGRLPRVPLILSAPMLEIAMPAAMRPVAKAIVVGARLIGRADRWPPFGDVATPYLFQARFADNVLTGDRAVFDWLIAALRADPRLQLAMPSIAWFGAAEAAMDGAARLGPLGRPALCLIGSAEAVVVPEAARRVALNLGARVAIIPGARHEVLIEAPGPRAVAWAEVDAFLAEAGV